MNVKQINDLAWKLIPVAVAFIVFAAWFRVHRSRRAGTATGEKPERWVWQRNGQVDGPRLASWRIRRALRPYAELVPWTGSHESWTKAGRGTSVKARRKVHRLWSDIADALDWPSVYEHYYVTPEERCFLVSAKERPDEAELSRKLAVLRIRNHRSRVELRFVDDEPDLLELVISDVVTCPIQHEVVPVRTHRVSTTIDGVTTWEDRDVRDQRALYVVTGRRFTSLYDDNATWTDIPADDTADEAYGPDFIIANQTLPAPAREPLRGAIPPARWEGDPTPSRDNAQVVLTPGQFESLMQLGQAGGLSVSALARRQDSVWGVAKRRLDRLAGHGLVVRVADDRWELTSSARELLGLPDAPAPWPAPMPEEAS